MPRFRGTSTQLSPARKVETTTGLVFRLDSQLGRLSRVPPRKRLEGYNCTFNGGTRRALSGFDEIFRPLARSAKLLDMHYTATRYPNAIDGSLTPAEFYEEEQSEECIKSAELLLQLVRKLLAS